MKVLGAQNTSYLTTQTMPFWERKYIVWYICLLSPAGSPARITSLLWLVVKFSPHIQSQTKARDTRTPQGSHCLWSENTFPDEKIAGDSSLNIWEKPSQFRFQGENLKAWSHPCPTTEAESSAVDAWVGPKRSTSGWQFPTPKPWGVFKSPDQTK